MSTIDPNYRVLARKYRPQTFSALIGQDAMVRTLKNAIDSGRLAHAFIMTGVRGVGKTTTARLIARALNCVGADGKGGPTVDPCGVCDFCVSIAKSTHPDVIEMDAASHTGVDDIRAIIDNAPYASTAARFKIYIIDEVHMLSKSAFNALLKTLEEPPAHVKFIFATTEIRKVPVTVLSRCQRFDLRRVDAALLANHFKSIIEKEGLAAEDEALGLIAKAAEGSVRDGLSLLDQAIAHSAGEVSAEQVRSMIGLADRTAVITLYEAVMAGDAPGALAALARQYEAGADPQVVLEDMLAFTHWLTRLKLAGDAAQDSLVSEVERVKGAELSAKLSVPTLSKTWQILLKGLEEVRRAPNTLAAAEMVLIRLLHASNLPNPADLVKKLQNGEGVASAPRPAPAASPSAGPSATVVQMRPRMQAVPAAQTITIPNFEAMVALFEKNREGLIGHALRDHVHLVAFEQGRIELRLGELAPRDLPKRMMTCLESWTGERWLVALTQEGGERTLKDKEIETKTAHKEEAEAHPVVQKVLKVFPGAKIKEVHTRKAQQDFMPEPPAQMLDGPPLDVYEDALTQDEFFDGSE